MSGRRVMMSFMTNFYTFIIDSLILINIPALFLTYPLFVESSWHRHGQYLFSAPIVPATKTVLRTSFYFF